jgi:hypothetical protein
MNSRSPPVQNASYLSNSPRAPTRLNTREPELISGITSALNSVNLDAANASDPVDLSQAGSDQAVKGEKHNLQMSSSRRSSGSTTGSDFKLSRDAVPFRPGSTANPPSLTSAASSSTFPYPPTHISIPVSLNSREEQQYELKPRQGLEGYGFRPRSGASTPTTGFAATAFSPLVNRSAQVTSASSKGQVTQQARGSTDHVDLSSTVSSSSLHGSRKTLGSRHEQEADLLDDLDENGGDLLGRGGVGFDDVEDRDYGFGRNPMTASEIADSEGLGWPAKLTHQRLHATPDQQAANLSRLSGAVRTVLECIGEDPDREGLERTPERYAKALLWMTKGYEERLSGEYARTVPRKRMVDQLWHIEICNDAIFKEDHDEMVLVRDIKLFSMCEHRESFALNHQLMNGLINRDLQIWCLSMVQFTSLIFPTNTSSVYRNWRELQRHLREGYRFKSV